jgi:hypothetical protein
MPYVFHIHEEIAWWLEQLNGEPFTREQLLAGCDAADDKMLDHFIHKGYVVREGDQLRYVHKRKPRRPCVGCGFCCKQAPCHLGEGVPCRFLAEDEEQEGRYRCKKVLEAGGDLRILLERELAIGQGCCSPLFNSDRETLLRFALKSS